MTDRPGTGQHEAAAVDVSIIIPTFNRLWCLPEAIASCPRDDRVEIIVIDDGSTDATWDWLSRQPGVRAVRQTNWGKGAAVNAAFALARGTYVRFLDSDDLLVPEQAMAQLDFTLAAGVDICVAGYTAFFEPSGAEILHGWSDCGDFLAQQLGECDSSHYSAFLFRRAFIADVFHRPEYSVHDDRMFILECAVKEPRVAVWPQPTLRHRHHDNERIQFRPGSTSVVANWQDLRMFRKIAALLDQRGLLTDRRKAAIANNIWPLALRIGGYNRREAREAIAWLHTLDPGFTIPRQGRDRLYRLFGFSIAQSLVNGARTLRDGWCTVRDAVAK